MKSALIATCLVASLWSTGASTEIVFHGTINVAAATHCLDWHPGDNALSSYQPRVARNANFTGLSYVSRFEAQGYGL